MFIQYAVEAIAHIVSVILEYYHNIPINLVSNQSDRVSRLVGWLVELVG